MLVVRDLSVRLGRRAVLGGLALRATAGQVTAIVGPNGSGKSTLLRAMTGDVAYDGCITLNGRDTRSLSPRALAGMRGVLPQASSIAFPFTAREVVTIGLRSGPNARRDALPMDALTRVGLAHLADRPYQHLSGGEQQRVQLARVLAQIWEPETLAGPRWLLLDEPVSALDIGHQLMVMGLMQDFAARGGGVVAVMHDLNLTAAFAAQVVVLADGRKLADGPPSRVLTDEILSRAYNHPVRVGQTPPPGTPFILPTAAPSAA